MENAGLPVKSEETVIDPLQLFAVYPFSADSLYQEGVESIVLSGVLAGKSQDEQETILLQSRIYFFNRMTGHSLSVDDVRRSGILSRASEDPVCESAASTSAGPSTSGTEDSSSETRTLSFAELKELIEQGQTDQIPNNRVIPNELSPEKPSESQGAMRKKPWELAEPLIQGSG